MIEFIKAVAPSIMIAIVGAVLYYKKGGDALDDRLMANYKALDEQQKSQIAEKNARIEKYQIDIGEIKASMNTLKENFAKETGRLQGQIDSKDKQLAELRTIALDPTLNLPKMIVEIHGFMEELTKSNLHQVSMLEKQVKDEDAIAHRDRNLESGRTK